MAMYPRKVEAVHRIDAQAPGRPVALGRYDSEGNMLFGHLVITYMPGAIFEVHSQEEWKYLDEAGAIREPDDLPPPPEPVTQRAYSPYAPYTLFPEAPADEVSERDDIADRFGGLGKMLA